MKKRSVTRLPLTKKDKLARAQRLIVCAGTNVAMRPPFQGISDYKEEYVEKEIVRVKSMKPSRLYQKADSAVDGDTVYKLDYVEKSAPRAPSFKPVIKLQGNAHKFEGATVTKEDYTSKPIVKVQSFKPAKSYDPKASGEFSGETCSKASYKPFDAGAGPQQSCKPMIKYSDAKGEFSSNTTNKDDYVQFDTVSPAKSLKPERKYDPSSLEQFEGHSIYHEDYTEKHGERTQSMKPQRVSQSDKDRPKFDGISVSKDDFTEKHISKIASYKPVIKYDPNGNGPLEKGTLYRDDFIPKEIQLVQSCKPVRKFEDSKFPLENMTVNRESYIPKEIIKTISFKPQIQYDPNASGTFEGETTTGVDYDKKRLEGKTGITPSFKPVLKYANDKAAFDGTTTHKTDFIEHEGAGPAASVKPSQGRDTKLSPFEGKSIYTEDYDEKKAERVKQIRPGYKEYDGSTRPKFDGTSVNRETFTPKEITKTGSYKPKAVYDKNANPGLEKTSTYILDFIAKDITPVANFKPVIKRDGVQQPFEGLSECHEEFVARKGEVPASFKPQVKYDPSKNGKFEGESVQKSDFNGSRFNPQPKVVDSFKPKRVYSDSKAKFQGETTQKRDFQGHDNAQPALSLKPIRKYDASQLGAFEGQSVYTGDFEAKPIELVASMKPKNKGTSGDRPAFEKITVNRETYTPKEMCKVASYKPVIKYDPNGNGPLEKGTLYRDDFIPKEIQLVQSCKPVRKFEDSKFPLENMTVNRESYIPKEIIKTISFKPQIQYDPNASGTFEGETTTGVDYDKKRLEGKTGITPSFKPVLKYANDKAAFDGTTTHKTDFIEHEGAGPAASVKPSQGRDTKLSPFEGKSIYTEDYDEKKAERVKQIRPGYKEYDGSTRPKFDGTSVNRETFTPKEITKTGSYKPKAVYDKNANPGLEKTSTYILDFIAKDITPVANFKPVIKRDGVQQPFEGLSECHEEFVARKGEVPASFKPQVKYDPSKNGKFEGESVQKSDFNGSRFNPQPKVVDSFKPKRVYSDSKAKFQGETTQKRDFQGHDNAQPALSLKPIRKYDASQLGAFEGQSVYTGDFEAKPIELVASMKPKNKGTSGDRPGFENKTVSREEYTAKEIAKVESFKPVRKYEVPTEKLEGSTVYKSDFFEKERQNVTNYAPKVNRSNNQQPFEGSTTTGESYTKKPLQNTANFKPKLSYDPDKAGKFDGTSVMKSEFTDSKLKSAEPVKSFKPPNRYVSDRPKFEGISTQKSDFVTPEKISSPQNFKPKRSWDKNNIADFEDETTYRTDFTTPPNEPIVPSTI
eukprot:Nk52_evm22s243 gene=Nk52_evmTU22s243